MWKRFAKEFQSCGRDKREKGRGLTPSLFFLVLLFLLPVGTENAEVRIRTIEDVLNELKDDHKNLALEFISEKCSGAHCEAVKESVIKFSEKIDPLLLSAVIYVESSFKPYAVSNKGAIGIMQLMPEAGWEVARELGLPYDEGLLFDIKYNLTLGTNYLIRMLKLFNGNLRMALLAYNYGPSFVRSRLNEGEWLPMDYFPKIRKAIEEVFRL